MSRPTAPVIGADVDRSSSAGVSAGSEPRVAIVGASVHVYPAALKYQARIRKIASALASRRLSERVLLVAVGEPSAPDRERIGPYEDVVRVPMAAGGKGFLRKSLAFAAWSVRVFLELRATRVGVVNCHTLSTLPLCVALKVHHGVPLIYEPHELETETSTSTGLRRVLARRLERALIRFADRVITVSSSIAEQYATTYGIPDVETVLNVPVLDALEPVPDGAVYRHRFGIPPDHLVFLYQGLLTEPRGVRLLLDAFRDVSPDRHLVLMGFGAMEEEIRAVAAESPNIHLHEPVPTGEVVRFTRGADVGFALLDDGCLNHRFALPNKFFHYLHAGVPVIASDLPEMGRIVDAFECGWRVGYKAGKLVELVTTIDRADVQSKREGTRRARLELHWGREVEKLERIYRGLAPGGREAGTAP